MIVHEFFEDNTLCKTYSDNNKMVKQVLDRLGKPIREDAIYAEAVDMVIDGKPRYDYVETDIDIEVEEEVLEEGETDEVVEESQDDDSAVDVGDGDDIDSTDIYSD